MVTEVFCRQGRHLTAKGMAAFKDMVAAPLQRCGPANTRFPTQDAQHKLTDTKKRSNYPRGTDQISRTGDAGLTKLWRASVRLERLQTLLRAALPGDVRADQVRVASLRGPTLTLLVNSSAWAARLRFDVPMLLTRLSELADFQGLKQIRLQVGAPDIETSHTVERPMSAAAANTLVECAAQLPEGELRDTVLALAKHGQQ